MIPTRFIDKPEYEALLDMENTYVIIHQLDAMDFLPPKPDVPAQETINSDHVHILFLNAVEPCIYWDKQQGAPLIILPKYNDLSYEVFQEIHPMKGAWAYRLSPHNWDSLDWDHHELQYTDYWFKPSDVLPFVLADERTH